MPIDKNYTKAESDRAFDRIIEDIQATNITLQFEVQNARACLERSNERLRSLHSETMAVLDRSIVILKKIAAKIDAEREEKMANEQPIICPDCNEILQFIPAHPAVAKDAVKKWNGGYDCSNCGWVGGEGWD